MIQLTCKIPSDLHLDAKLLSVTQGVSLREVVTEALSRHVADFPPVIAGNSIRRKTRRED